MRKAFTIFVICLFCSSLTACSKKWGIPDPGGNLWTTKKRSHSTSSAPKTTTKSSASSSVKEEEDEAPSSLTGAVRPSAN